MIQPKRRQTIPTTLPPSPGPASKWLRNVHGCLLLACFGGLLGLAAEVGAQGVDVPDHEISAASHGISMFGDLAYPDGFAHFGYVNPEAPKGGTLRIPAYGTYDSLNGFIRKGRAAQGVSATSNFIYDTLAVAAEDEPASHYGLLAAQLGFSRDGRSLLVSLRPQARWHDGKPLTSDDVVFSFERYKSTATPTLRLALAGLVSTTAQGAHRVRFTLRRPFDRQLALTLVGLPILPRHYWQTREFEATTLEPPLASGPYRVAATEPGRSIRFERVDDYWGKDLPVNVGRFNFDRIHVEYFLDTDVQLEALKADAIDHTLETVSKTWAEGYDFPARERGDFKLELVETRSPATVRAIVFNTRVAKLRDVRVRKALAYAFDREWKNRVQTHDVYEPGDSYFSNSDLAHVGPPSAEERALLEPFRNQLPEELFEGPFRIPRTEGVGRNRANLEVALGLLREAGYEVRDDRLVDRETGEPFTLELLLDSSARIRMSLLYADALRRLGIETTLRVLETAQFINRRRAFQFELLYSYIRLRPVPGPELGIYFSSASAESPNSRNYAGVRDPVVDALIERIARSKSYPELVVASRALDRVLLWGYYIIDLGYSRGARYAYWDRFGKPDAPTLFTTGFPHTWWYDEARASRIGRRATTAAPAPSGR